MFLAQGTEVDIGEGESTENCVSCIRERNVKNLGNIVTGIMFLAEERGREEG